MQRLTYQTISGDYKLILLPQDRQIDKLLPLIQLVGAYEDTNLTPAEIESMKAENKRLNQSLELSISHLKKYNDCAICSQPCGGCNAELIEFEDCDFGWEWIGLEDRECKKSQ